MSRVKYEAPAPGSGEGAEGHPTVPHLGSVACRSCGTAVPIAAGGGDAVTCPDCDTVNIAPQEVLADAAH